MLKDLQHHFLNWVTDGDQSIHPAITDSDQSPRDVRLAIYKDAYVLRLQEVLEDDFDMTSQLCDDWDAVSRAYIDAHPSTSFSVQDFGAEFPQFLQENLALSQAGILVDMATFEWAMVQSFLAKDQLLLSMEHLQQLNETTWPAAKFCFAEHVHVLAHHWPVGTMWQGEQGERGALQHTLVWRQNMETYFQALTKTEAQLLPLFQQALPFAALCAQAEACLGLNEGETIQAVAAFIQTHLPRGLFAAYHSQLTSTSLAPRRG